MNGLINKGVSFENRRGEGPGDEVVCLDGGRGLNMADVQTGVKDFTTKSPDFFPIKLEEYSFPVVRSSFSRTSFSMNYYRDTKTQGVVSKLIYVSSKDSATKLTHRLQ